MTEMVNTQRNVGISFIHNSSLERKFPANDITSTGEDKGRNAKPENKRRTIKNKREITFERGLAVKVEKTNKKKTEKRIRPKRG